MKHQLIYAAIVMSAIGFTAPFAGAGDAAKTAVCQAKTQSVAGTINVEKDFEGGIEKITLTASVKDSEGKESDVAYNVTLDANGKKLPTIDGKKVEVSAVLTKKEVKTKNDEDETETTTELWLTVKSCKVVEAKAEVTESDE